MLAHLGLQSSDSVTLTEDGETTPDRFDCGGTARWGYLAAKVPTGQMACASCVDVEPRPIKRWQIELETP